MNMNRNLRVPHLGGNDESLFDVRTTQRPLTHLTNYTLILVIKLTDVESDKSI